MPNGEELLQVTRDREYHFNVIVRIFTFRVFEVINTDITPY